MKTFALDWSINRRNALDMAKWTTFCPWVNERNCPASPREWQSCASEQTCIYCKFWWSYKCQEANWNTSFPASTEL